MMSKKVGRVGLGMDSHRMESGRPCHLGGVLFEDCPVGPLGHSDGDAVIHALCDAILGAAGLDDLGTLFPDTDPKWKGVGSDLFLKETISLLDKENYRICNCDIVVICDEPKIGPFREKIRKSLAETMAILPEQINVKGKTTEGSDTGRVEVTAIVLIER
ncbi:MAG: 2-C-methyl-D-erythritol 2,4-cyclodiphosphate synthase [Planctomycetota bacterium]|jgi:2-C-methyl-D-erythritol 2,4-cyclodiphosphate synthase|nr:2-C-methyl-D-erythritol 2,4-cyclodiphosphate synthase [Planctomycetota bacterium]MDP6942295.1 2-C-methyl-D-erythritol 2,4-cyclodiphosphate synthase [Planctomycetota bacterium]